MRRRLAGRLLPAATKQPRRDPGHARSRAGRWRVLLGRRGPDRMPPYIR